MNNLFELTIIKPDWYAKDFDHIEDYQRSTRINFGVVMGNTEDIINIFLNFNNNKQEIFNDFKEFKENISNNRKAFDLKEIDNENFSKNQREIINNVNEKYKISLEKLILLFFKEPLNNKYEYNLVRNIPQNFLELNTVIHNLGENGWTEKIKTEYLVYEENDFEFTDKCISLVPFNLKYIDLTK